MNSPNTKISLRRNLIACPDWEWADFDRGQVVWAEAGKLYRSALFAGDGVRPSLLHDFAPYAFEPIAAPYTEAGNRPHKRKAEPRK